MPPSLALARALGLAALAATLLTVPCATALAQPTSPEPDPVQLFDEGNALYREGKFDEAELKLQQSFDLKPVYDTAANLGDCEIHVGQLTDAAKHLSYAVQNFPVTGSDEVRATMKSRLGEALAKVGALTIQPSIPGAAVTVDGKKVGVSPLDADVYVDPGEHTVSATKEGHERGSATVNAVAGERQTVGLTLKLVEGNGGGGGGGRSANGEGGGKVHFGWPLATGVIALAGIGVGVAGMVIASGAESDNEELRATLPSDRSCNSPSSENQGTCDELASTVDTQESGNSMAVAGFVIGGLAATLTIGFFIFTDVGTGEDDDDADPVALQLAPVIGPDTQGLMLSGSW